MKTIASSVIALLLVTAPRALSQQAVPLSPDERLSRMEQQAAALLEEIRKFRAEAKAEPTTGGTRGVSEPAKREMQPGVLANVYVRTGGADTYTPPPSDATPSDKRVTAGSHFNVKEHAKSAGYDRQPVTVVWEGYFKVEAAGVYEFLLDSTTAVVNIGPKTLTKKGEKSVRLDFEPGYWPVKISNGARQGFVSPDVVLKVKRSGLDPTLITPGSLWTPKTSP